MKGQKDDSSGDRARNLQREPESTRMDAEGMLQMMSGMEHQITELFVREDSMIAIVRESKQRVLLARYQTRALEIQSTRELAQVLESRKKDGGEHVREMTGGIQATINKLHAQLGARDARMQGLAAPMSLIRGETERVRRDRAYIEEVYLSPKCVVEGDMRRLR